MFDTPSPIQLPSANGKTDVVPVIQREYIHNRMLSKIFPLAHDMIKEVHDFLVWKFKDLIIGNIVDGDSRFYVGLVGYDSVDILIECPLDIVPASDFWGEISLIKDNKIVNIFCDNYQK